MKSVMLDLETLSTSPDGAIISAGVAVFDENGVTFTQGWALQLGLVTGHIDPATVKWWMDQNEIAKSYSFSGTEVPIKMLAQLGNILQTADELWANDPDFDCVLLRSWWERTSPGCKFPVSFRKFRSYRTMRAEADRLGLPYAHVWGNGHVAHNPIDDAAVQARVIIEIRKQLDKIGSRISI